ncbi:ankyrin repeat domain-containing protein [Temperatibacter marinus]|uniref:Ankyrin repeat domain-containing protein n=1 Tax=Temperatibacter marinus TaxID=1456591 RepID=A0AA52EIC9_9PROT|nr:ankyrin repeat domain-containing protein [Temperatibacter marinus]WND02591.1 ankyrin repeat domain-containing protein [Temperatibacter marinus]
MSICDLIEKGDIRALQTHLKNHPAKANDNHSSGISALMFALYYQRKDMAEVIASYKLSCNFGELIAMGRLEDVRAQLDADISLLKQPSPDGFYPLHYAAYFKTDEILAYLIQKGCNLNIPAENPSAVCPIHTAVAAGDAACVTLLTEAGCLVNVKQAGGWTPLMAAAKSGRQDLIDILLAVKADPLLTSDDGQTASDLAREATHTQISLALDQG